MDIPAPSARARWSRREKKSFGPNKSKSLTCFAGQGFLCIFATCSASSEHIAISEVIIIDEEITSVSLVIEVRSQMAHHVIEIVALIHDVLSEILLRIPLAHIAILEAINAVIVEANK